jgi:hypothetical protein
MEPTKPHPTLFVEAPNTTAVLSFLDTNITVEVTIRVDEEGWRHVEIETRAADGEGSSSFKYEVAGPSFPPYEKAPEPEPLAYALVRLPLSRYGLAIDDPEAHQQKYPELTHWRDAVHDGRRVDGIYMLVPDKVGCRRNPYPWLISLTLVGVEIEWPDYLDDEAREGLHECEDAILSAAREWDGEFIDIDMDDLFTERNVWHPDVCHAELGEFASFEEALEHWSANPPMVPTTPPADAGKE